MAILPVACHYQARARYYNGSRDGVVRSENGEAVGWLHFKADSIDHAIDLAKGCPVFETDGNLEIREILEM